MKLFDLEYWMGGKKWCCDFFRSSNWMFLFWVSTQTGGKQHCGVRQLRNLIWECLWCFCSGPCWDRSFTGQQRPQLLILGYHLHVVKLRNIPAMWIIAFSSETSPQCELLPFSACCVGLCVLHTAGCVFLPGQEGVRPKCGDVWGFFCPPGTFRIQQASGWHGTNLPRVSLWLRRSVMPVCCSPSKSSVCTSLRWENRNYPSALSICSFCAEFVQTNLYTLCHWVY